MSDGKEDIMKEKYSQTNHKTGQTLNRPFENQIIRQKDGKSAIFCYNNPMIKRHLSKKSVKLHSNCATE